MEGGMEETRLDEINFALDSNSEGVRKKISNILGGRSIICSSDSECGADCGDAGNNACSGLSGLCKGNYKL